MLADGIGTITPEEMAERIRTLPQTIADDCHENGQVLRCSSCGRELDLTPEAWARYLSTGWPACHGQTMAIENPPTTDRSVPA